MISSNSSDLAKQKTALVHLKLSFVIMCIALLIAFVLVVLVFTRNCNFYGS